MSNLQPAIDLIKHWEGCVLHAYRDPVGIWTIGYGTTQNVKPGQVITKAQAIQLLERDVLKCAGAIAKLVKVPASDNELCALISFAYNVGLGALGKSTLLKKLNAGRPRREVADEFLKWVRAGGRVLPGLVNRRKEERALFLAHHALVDVIEA